MTQTKVTTIEEAKELIKKKCDGAKLEESVIKGHKWFLEDIEADELNQNQSQGNHFDTDEEVIDMCNTCLLDDE
jgi:hypothetical protein